MKLQTKNSKKVNVKLSRIERVGEKAYFVYVDAKGNEYKYQLLILLEPKDEHKIS